MKRPLQPIAHRGGWTESWYYGLMDWVGAAGKSWPQNEDARNRSPWRLRCGDLAGQSDLHPASRLAMRFRLAPAALSFARLARQPPACTGGCAFPLTTQEQPPDPHRSYALQQCRMTDLRLAPDIASFGPASDRTSGLRQTLYLPATPAVRFPACAEPGSSGAVEEVPPAFTGCPVPRPSLAAGSSLSLGARSSSFTGQLTFGLRPRPSLPAPLADLPRLSRNLDSLGTSGG